MSNKHLRVRIHFYLKCDRYRDLYELTSGHNVGFCCKVFWRVLCLERGVTSVFVSWLLLLDYSVSFANSFTNSQTRRIGSSLGYNASLVYCGNSGLQNPDRGILNLAMRRLARSRLEP
jgi:hypothetical protein